MLGKDREMMRFAEEGGEVRRQRIDEFLPLHPITALEQRQIVAKGLQPRLAQAPRQAAVDHVLLGGRERNPGMVVDQFPHAFEIGVGKDELSLAGFAKGCDRIEYWLLFHHRQAPGLLQRRNASSRLTMRQSTFRPQVASPRMVPRS